MGAVLLFEADVFLAVDARLDDALPLTGFFPFGATLETVVFFGAALVAALAGDFFAADDVVFFGAGFLDFKAVFICSSSFSAVAVGAIISA